MSDVQRCVNVSGRRKSYQCGAPADLVVDGRPLCSTHAGYERAHPEAALRRLEDQAGSQEGPGE